MSNMFKKIHNSFRRKKNIPNINELLEGALASSDIEKIHYYLGSEELLYRAEYPRHSRVTELFENGQWQVCIALLEHTPSAIKMSFIMYMMALSLKSSNKECLKALSVRVSDHDILSEKSGYMYSLAVLSGRQSLLPPDMSEEDVSMLLHAAVVMCDVDKLSWITKNYSSVIRASKRQIIKMAMYWFPGLSTFIVANADCYDVQSFLDMCILENHKEAFIEAYTATVESNYPLNVRNMQTSVIFQKNDIFLWLVHNTLLFADTTSHLQCLYDAIYCNDIEHFCCVFDMCHTALTPANASSYIQALCGVVSENSVGMFKTVVTTCEKYCGDIDIATSILTAVQSKNIELLIFLLDSVWYNSTDMLSDRCLEAMATLDRSDIFIKIFTDALRKTDGFERRCLAVLVSAGALGVLKDIVPYLSWEESHEMELL